LKEYEVKVIVTETHYTTVEAKDKADAERQGEEYGFCAQDAISTDVEVESVTLKKTKKYKNLDHLSAWFDFGAKR